MSRYLMAYKIDTEDIQVFEKSPGVQIRRENARINFFEILKAARLNLNKYSTLEKKICKLL